MAPWGDVVGFHLLDGEMFSTNRANAKLLFIDFSFCVVVEGSQVKVPLVAVKYILVDATFTLHVAILHETRHLGLQFLCIEIAVMMPTVQRTPVDTFHLFAVFGEYRLYPTYYIAKMIP